MKEFVLYRWDSRDPMAPHYLVVEADVWERRKRLSIDQGEEPARFELARGSKKLMLKLGTLATDEKD